MTEQEQKELAEWAAEWLGDEYTLLEIFSSIGDCEKKWIFFEAKMYAPILAHLAKRKMEEMGFYWISSYGYHSLPQKTEYFYEFMKWGDSTDKDIIGPASHENEYAALWLAIREAVKG